MRKLRKALQQLAEADPPNWLSLHMPDGVWNWAFELTADEALAQKAALTLATDSRITVYDFMDGQEFNRRDANPFAGLRRSMEIIADGITKMGENVNAMFASLSEAINKTTP